jgi:hypothetical protein
MIMSDRRITPSDQIMIMSDRRITPSDQIMTMSSQRITSSDRRITPSDQIMIMSDRRITPSDQIVIISDPMSTIDDDIGSASHHRGAARITIGSGPFLKRIITTKATMQMTIVVTSTSARRPRRPRDRRRGSR